MAQTKKILDYQDNGKHYEIIKTNDTINPYRIYKRFYDYNKYGRLTERKIQLEKYADAKSAVFHLYSLIER